MVLAFMKKKFYISYKAVVWFPTCEKRLSTDQQLSKSSNDRAKRRVTKKNYWKSDREVVKKTAAVARRSHAWLLKC